MRRRRNADQVSGGANLNGAASSSSGTASQLGSAMDELMRHQPSLRVEAMNSIIKLLNQLIELGKNPNFICQRQSSSSSSSSSNQSSSKASAPTAATAARSTTAPTVPGTSAGVSNVAQASGNETVGTAPVSNTAQSPSSDDENNIEEYENAIMMVDSDNNTVQQQSSTGQTWVMIIIWNSPFYTHLKY